MPTFRRVDMEIGNACRVNSVFGQDRYHTHPHAADTTPPQNLRTWALIFPHVNSACRAKS